MDDDQPHSAAPDDGALIPAPPSPPSRPGAGIFTIEGRAAPGLFVVGWLATILGLAFVVVGALAGSRLFFLLLGPGLLSVGLIAGSGNQALERRARGDAYAGPSPWLAFATVIALTYFVATIVGSGLDAFTRSIGASPDGPLVQLISAVLTAAIFVGVVRLTVVGSGALSWQDMGLRRLDGKALTDLALGAVSAIPVITVTYVVAAILVSIFKVVGTSPLPPTGELGGLALQLIAGAVVAPIAEELFFRGFALTAWRRSLGARRAIIRATILFTLAHVLTFDGTDLPNVLALIAVGAGSRVPVAIALGWLYVRRGSLWAPIGLHATYNAALLAIGYLAINATPPG
jgi:membrane protease YdiL (CAAX protease family)